MDWPLVQADGAGIRSKWFTDRCFYCSQKIGEPHGPECVVVTKLVRYLVLATGHGHLGPRRRLGTFTRPDPHFWSEYDCWSHKNKSSWCASNCLDELAWDDPEDAAKGFLEHADCACNELEFELDNIVDDTPTTRDD